LIDLRDQPVTRDSTAAACTVSLPNQCLSCFTCIFTFDCIGKYAGTIKLSMIMLWIIFFRIVLIRLSVWAMLARTIALM